MRHDVGQVYVQLFDVTLEAYFGRHLLCIHAPTCGYGPALEHNGDLYSCDHFVEPRYLLGNIHQTHMLKLVASPEQRKFGDDKRDTLTAQCQSARSGRSATAAVRRTGSRVSRDGEPGQNYLCAGLELFFTHTRPAMRTMAQLLQQRRPPSEVMALDAAEDAKRGPYRALSLRERQEVPLLPRRQHAAFAVQPARFREGRARQQRPHLRSGRMPGSEDRR